MLIQIDGWYAGGKSVLWSLLDGHKDIFVIPVHDYSYQAFLKSSNDDLWIKNKDIITLRKLLSEQGYHRFENAYLRKKLYIHLSSNNYISLDYNANFYEFDKKFISKIIQLDNWSIDKIIEILYSEFYIQYTNNSDTMPKYYASMGHPLSVDYYTTLKQILPNSKRIVVKRDIKNIIATRINRCDTNGLVYKSKLLDILSNSEIVDILKYYHDIEMLALENPTQIYITNLSDLINHTKEEMQKIAKFLDIEFNDILTIPTRDGILLEQNGESFIGRENDIAENLLSKKESILIDKFLEENLLFKTNLTKNIPIAHSISKISKEIHMVKQKYNKIIVYGNGYLGQTIAPFLEQKLVGIVDKYKYSKSSDKDYKIISIDDLNKIDYDIIVITVLGREYEIVLELINMGIGMNKILVL